MFKLDLSAPTTRITLAIIASALLHALFVTSRMIELPKPDFDSASFFTATLEPISQLAGTTTETAPPIVEIAEQKTPVVPKPEKPVPSAKTEAPAATEEIATISETEQSEQGQAEQSSSESTQDGPTTLDPGTAPRPLPNFVELAFNYFDGQQQLRGTAFHTVKIHHQHYVLTAKSEGDLDGYFKEEETSRGTFNQYGFRSGTYVNRSQSRTDSAELNWNTQAITQNGRPSNMPMETQDGLSWLYQLSQLPLHGPTLSIAITNGGQLREYQLTPRGVEMLQTAAGELRALHIERTDAQGDQITHIWLAVDHKLLPVRVLQTTSDNTVIYDMQIQGVRISENL